MRQTRVLVTSNLPRLTRRSRHIHAKYHWFRGHLIPGVIVIADIDSKDQLGDIFTKALVATIFEYLRNQLLGWIPS
jgi:hypothetical protein